MAGVSPRSIFTAVYERGLNLRDFAPFTRYDDASSGFEEAFEKMEKSGIKTMYVPGDTYNVSKTIVVPRGVQLVFAPNAIIKPQNNINIFQMKPLASVEGATIDLKSFPSYDKACFYFNAADIFQFYEQSHVLKDINIMGVQKSSGWLGTGILMEANTPDSYIDNVKCNNITMTNIGKGIHLRVDPSITDNNHPSWVNANQFHQITIMNFDYGIYLEGHNSIPRDVGGNLFSQLQLQAEAGSKRMIYCESALNHFDGFFWDLHKMQVTNPAFEFTKTSKFNEVKSAMAQELTESWVDDGYLNSFPSPNNYVSDKRINAFPVSIPYTPNFLGNQDDWMVNGDKRGFTITQTSTHPIISGELTDLLSFDTEAGVTFNMSNVTYENPVVLEIDLSTDPCWYASFLTAVSPWGFQPKGYELDMFDIVSNKWMGGVHWTKNNKSQSHAVSAPWAGADKCTKVRIKFWGNNKVDDPKKPSPIPVATISRIMMTSTKDGGRAYMPYTATPTLPPPDITPILPADKTMVGDQDDILVQADKRYTVASIGAAKTGGNIFGMFSLRKEQFCRWTNPTLAAPIVIEIDFGAKPIPYMESVGIAFGQGETPTNVKIERVTASGGSYVQLTNQAGLKTPSLHVASRAAQTYKLKFTIWGANNINTLVRVNRIFGTTGDGYPVAFVNTESDNTVYGDLSFGDTAKGIVLRSPDGSNWKMSIGNDGVQKWTKI